MRSSHRCPKCAHDTIYCFPRLTDAGRKPVGVYVRPGHPNQVIGSLEAYVCQACGYTELYTARHQDLKVDQLPGVQVLTATDGPAYR